MKDLEGDSILFGQYIKDRREKLNKSIRGLAAELEMTPAYLSDIEKGNRYAPEKFLDIIIDKLKVPDDEKNKFYDLVGKSRNNNYPDLNEYIGSSNLARVALRKARDIELPKEKWQHIIDEMDDYESKDR